MRIEPAKDLLQTKSVTDAAFVCGFNNLSYFSKVFRQYTGETRIQWQKARGSPIIIPSPMRSET